MTRLMLAAALILGCCTGASVNAGFASFTAKDTPDGAPTRLGVPALAPAPHVGVTRPRPRRVTPTRATRTRTPRPNPTAPRGHVLETTAYTWTGNRTASGLWPSPGMAAGPWPFGTRLRIEGVGVVTITDRIGCCTDLDIYVQTETAARAFGRQHLHVEVLP